MRNLLLLLSMLLGAGVSSPLSNRTGVESSRDKRVLSLFSIVNFPNLRCETTGTSTTYGTCISTSECTSQSGSASGTCAAGFGVCCYHSVSTCASTISYNNSYIQNPGYPSSYTPTATGTCKYTINKASDDVCQIRLDFETFTGFTATTVGVKTDYMTAAGATGKNPPTISSTNTGYHMYLEVGQGSSDTASVEMTWGDITTAKQYNIFVQQIECGSEMKAPTDCVQYFTGTSGTIQSYGWAGGQLLDNMQYTNCIRTEEGYCGIKYKETAGTSIDAFAIVSPAAAAIVAEATDAACVVAGSALLIPKATLDGTTASLILPQFPSEFCGGFLGLDASTGGMTLQSNEVPFQVGLFTKTAGFIAPSTGFSLDYTQVACST